MKVDAAQPSMDLQKFEGKLHQNNEQAKDLDLY